YCGPGTIDPVVAHADRARPASIVNPRFHQPIVPALRCALIGILPVPRLAPHPGTTGGENAIVSMATKKRRAARPAPPRQRPIRLVTGVGFEPTANINPHRTSFERP